MKKFTVTRDDIVTHSVSATYMIDPTTGYIRIKNFGENTYGEVLSALAELSQHGFENLMIDLRDNSGGLMASAIQIADEFLPKGSLIVYCQDGPEGIAIVPMEYELDLETGEVTFSQAA